MRCWDKNMKGQERIQQRFVPETHILRIVEFVADAVSVLDSKNTTSR